MSTEERDYFDLDNLKLKKLSANYEPTRPYHLEVFRDRVRQAASDSAVTRSMAESYRSRDHTKDFTAILELINQER